MQLFNPLTIVGIQHVCFNSMLIHWDPVFVIVHVFVNAEQRCGWEMILLAVGLNLDRKNVIFATFSLWSLACDSSYTGNRNYMKKKKETGYLKCKINPE